MLKRKFDISVMAVCMALLGYFAWYGFEGPRSFNYRDGLSGKNEALAAKLASIEAAGAALERRVQLMRPESVDPDMLEELARANLDFARPNDLILRQKQ